MSFFFILRNNNSKFNINFNNEFNTTITVISFIYISIYLYNILFKNKKKYLLSII